MKRTPAAEIPSEKLPVLKRMRASKRLREETHARSGDAGKAEGRETLPELDAEELELVSGGAAWPFPTGACP